MAKAKASGDYTVAQANKRRDDALRAALRTPSDSSIKSPTKKGEKPSKKAGK